MFCLFYNINSLLPNLTWNKQQQQLVQLLFSGFSRPTAEVSISLKHKPLSLPSLQSSSGSMNGKNSRGDNMDHKNVLNVATTVLLADRLAPGMVALNCKCWPCTWRTSVSGELSIGPTLKQVKNLFCLSANNLAYPGGRYWT